MDKYLNRQTKEFLEKLRQESEDLRSKAVPPEFFLAPDWLTHVTHFAVGEPSYDLSNESMSVLMVILFYTDPLTGTYSVPTETLLGSTDMDQYEFNQCIDDLKCRNILI